MCYFFKKVITFCWLYIVGIYKIFNLGLCAVFLFGKLSPVGNKKLSRVRPIQRTFVKKIHQSYQVLREFFSKLCLASMSHKSKCPFSIQLLKSQIFLWKETKLINFSEFGAEISYLQKVEISTTRNLKKKKKLVMIQGNDAIVPLFQTNNEQPESKLALNGDRFTQPIQKAKKRV